MQELILNSRTRTQMQIRDLTPEQKLSVACPVCAAAPLERCCELSSGAFRFEEHLARLLSAAGQKKLALLPLTKPLSETTD